ncbi:hypothetical protein AAFN85_04570 [Mucilaginibacter sp. CAU 1740]|uniref:hypothetical protein n=1 Tax=Mucilaginibacter sp. CAU 1740 TaxID=3140365 RepID=UPI00325B5842
MKPTRDTAFLTIATAVISTISVFVIHFTQHMSLLIPAAFRYAISFIPVVCFAWFIIFVISILKHTREKAFVVNIFIIYLAYSVLQHIINIGIGVLGIGAEKIMAYYQIIGVINLLTVILLVVAVFTLSETEYRLPLRVFAFSELFIMVFYMVAPMLLSYINTNDFITYYQYMGFAYVVVPAAELYVAITALNIISNQPLQKPFYEMEKPEWPPYDKPGV